MFSQQTMVLLYDAKMEDIELQMINNSRDLRLIHKYRSVDIEELQDEYNLKIKEKREEQKQVASTDIKYTQLMTEITELQDELDRKQKRIEEESSDKETVIQQENDRLQTELEAIKADRDAIEENLEQDVEKNFGYFK